MKFSPNTFARISAKLRSEETREPARQELADLMAVLVGEDTYYYTHDAQLREKVASAIASFPAAERQNIVSELRRITSEAGWKMAHDIVAGALDLDKEIERTIGQSGQVEIYRHTVRRPENIQHFKDFMNPESGHTNYWIPRKYDIQRYVKAAVMAHQRSGRSGAIRVLDIGGGSGFLGKLIADEARNQGVELEVTVMDPDAETVTKAKETFSDTENLTFEIGTANHALSILGPELTDTERDRCNELEKKRLDILERGKEELSHIKALLASFEGESDDGTSTPDISSVLSGAFGSRARTILEQSGVALENLPPLEQIRVTLADFYNTRWASFQQEVLSICDEQEKIYAMGGVEKAKIDLVLNSWMPSGLDFTREIRMLNAPAIIYAHERSGTTGLDRPSESPINLGKESSYRTGDTYDAISWWEGVAISAVRGDKYSTNAANVSQIHAHKSIGISDKELEVPNPSEDEKYAWEKSLEQFIGRRRIEDKNFYSDS